MFTCYERNDFSGFERILQESHPDLEKNSLGFTLLVDRCMRFKTGDERYVKLLLEKGANPNFARSDSERILPLFFNRYDGPPDTFFKIEELLLQHGAEINYPVHGYNYKKLPARVQEMVHNNLLGSAVFRALETGDPRVVALLVHHGINTENSNNSSRMTSLATLKSRLKKFSPREKARYQGTAEDIVLLLEKGYSAYAAKQQRLIKTARKAEEIKKQAEASRQAQEALKQAEAKRRSEEAELQQKIKLEKIAELQREVELKKAAERQKKEPLLCSPAQITPKYQSKLESDHISPNLSIHTIRETKGHHFLIYVINEDWSINIYHRIDEEDNFITHDYLANNKPVRSAGEISFKDGKIMEINNCSGHYQPQGSLRLMTLTELIFQAAGFKEALGTYNDVCSSVPSESIRAERARRMRPFARPLFDLAKKKAVLSAFPKSSQPAACNARTGVTQDEHNALMESIEKDRADKIRMMMDSGVDFGSYGKFKLFLQSHRNLSLEEFQKALDSEPRSKKPSSLHGQMRSLSISGRRYAADDMSISNRPPRPIDVLISDCSSRREIAIGTGMSVEEMEEDRATKIQMMRSSKLAENYNLMRLFFLKYRNLTLEKFNSKLDEIVEKMEGREKFFKQAIRERNMRQKAAHEEKQSKIMATANRRSRSNNKKGQSRGDGSCRTGGGVPARRAEGLSSEHSSGGMCKYGGGAKGHPGCLDK